MADHVLIGIEPKEKHYVRSLSCRGKKLDSDQQAMPPLTKVFSFFFVHAGTAFLLMQRKVQRFSLQTQHMLDQLTDLQRREQMLCEANKCLRRKVINVLFVIVLRGNDQLEETSSQVHGQVWEHSANLLGYERQSPQQTPSHVGNGFFHPLEVGPEPTLQIG
ncbi:unnamed protein product [Miscanthus lutarioriparius]|uniref:Uncharacterized protein n=1 Tax=Miscanthus lutarioriparius TaxID=422564 RepID=A0A811QPX9_9POAL|nr:unnamed protein product [Miscanthus lutarioriparius]